MSVIAQYALIPTDAKLVFERQQRLVQLRNELYRISANSAFEVVNIQKEMRKLVYVLSHAGEAEAIGRALGKPQKVEIRREDIEKQSDRETMGGGDLFEKTYFQFKKIADKLIETVEISAIQKSNIKTVVERCLKAFPKARKLLITKANTLKPPKLKEANIKDVAKKIVTGFIDGFSWLGIEQEYQQDYVPRWRGPEFVVDTLGIKSKKKTDNEVYGWQIERDVMNDFVQQVRLGQDDAARNNGITDMQWIAIIDNRTDDCCRWRDGLTTSEIEAQLKSKHANDECQVIAAPAHFNCRCTMAPVTDDLPDVPPDTLGSFADWVTEMENT